MLLAYHYSRQTYEMKYIIFALDTATGKEARLTIEDLASKKVYPLKEYIKDPGKKKTYLTKENIAARMKNDDDWYIMASNTNSHFVAMVRKYKVYIDKYAYREYNDIFVLRKGSKTNLVYTRSNLNFGYERIDSDSFKFEANKKDFVSVSFQTGEWIRIAHNRYKTDAYYARTRTYGPSISRETSLEDTGKQNTGW